MLLSLLKEKDKLEMIVLKNHLFSVHKQSLRGNL